MVHRLAKWGFTIVYVIFSSWLCDPECTESNKFVKIIPLEQQLNKTKSISVETGWPYQFQFHICY
jgi:hypothetical protein